MGPGQLACAATLLLLLSVGPDRCLCAGCRELDFLIQVHDKALKSHAIKSAHVASEGACMAECYSEDRCVSYNLGPFQGGFHICELSDSNDVLHPEDLQQQGGYLFRAVKNPCNERPCQQHESACLAGFTNKGYQCICPAGFEGEHCEHVSDKDECTEQLHDCHEDAKCLNTIGSFYCTCKSGFYGDGRKCTVIEYFMADPAESCDSQCYKQGKRCVERGGFPGGNAKELFAALGFPCAQERDYQYADNPGYAPSTQVCWGNRNIPDAIHCAVGQNQNVRRLCPCA